MGRDWVWQFPMVICMSTENREDQLQLTGCSHDWHIAGVMRTEGWTVRMAGWGMREHSSFLLRSCQLRRLDSSSVTLSVFCNWALNFSRHYPRVTPIEIQLLESIISKIFAKLIKWKLAKGGWVWMKQETAEFRVGVCQFPFRLFKLSLVCQYSNHQTYNGLPSKLKILSLLIGV